jgi:hypothetical protein
VFARDASHIPSRGIYFSSAEIVTYETSAELTASITLSFWQLAGIDPPKKKGMMDDG